MKKILIALAFGSPESITPNRFLGVVAGEKIRGGEFILFKQKDVPISPNLQGIDIFPSKGRDLSGLQIIEGARDFLEGRGISYEEVFILAVPQHIRRCMRDARKVFKDRAVSVVAADLRLSPSWQRKFYCSTSTQWWTRGPVQWWVREIPIRILQVLWYGMYRKIAGCV